MQPRAVRTPYLPALRHDSSVSLRRGGWRQERRPASELILPDTFANAILLELRFRFCEPVEKLLNFPEDVFIP